MPVCIVNGYVIDNVEFAVISQSEVRATLTHTASVKDGNFLSFLANERNQVFKISKVYDDESFVTFSSQSAGLIRFNEQLNSSNGCLTAIVELVSDPEFDRYNNVIGCSYSIHLN